MEIIEKYIQSKTSNPGLCEDGLFVSDDYIAVIDGATSKTKTEWDGKKTGRIMIELILEKLKNVRADMDAGEFMLELDSVISDWYHSKNIYEQMKNNPVERCTGSVVVYSRFKNQIWFLGDCQSLVDGDLIDNPKLIDQVVSGARALYVQSQMLLGKTVKDLLAHDLGRDYITPLLENQNLFQNSNADSEFTHTLLDGFFIDTMSIKIHQVSDGAKEIVLASDGYPELASTLEESESKLKVLLEEDPLLVKSYKSTKGLRAGNVSYDDRAYVRFNI